jgi:hypothetical protein
MNEKKGLINADFLKIIPRFDLFLRGFEPSGGIQKQIVSTPGV